jgi:hypothetical protein
MKWLKAVVAQLSQLMLMATTPHVLVVKTSRAVAVIINE